MATHMSHQRHPVGTVIMRRDGNSYVKTREGWVAEHRLVKSLQLGRDLELGEKVFHLNNNLRGDEEFNDRDNLVVIKFRTTEWTKFVHSKVMFVPKKEPVKLKDFVRR